jgi:serine/threonine protein kinase
VIIFKRYLHDRGILHRDLKSSNVFLDMCVEPDDVGVCWRVKIGDFGLAAVKTVLAQGVNKQFQPTGSVLWMVNKLRINFQSKSFPFFKSPEVIQQKDPNCYSTSADVYAYGCVLFEMFSGKLPHTPISNKEQVSSIS